MGSAEGLHRIKIRYEGGHCEWLAYETQQSAFRMLDAMDGLVGQEGPGGIVAAVEYVNIIPGQTRPEQDWEAAAVEFRRQSMVHLDKALKDLRAIQSETPGQDDDDQDSAEKAAARAASTASSAR